MGNRGIDGKGSKIVEIVAQVLHQLDSVNVSQMLLRCSSRVLHGDSNGYEFGVGVNQLIVDVIWLGLGL